MRIQNLAAGTAIFWSLWCLVGNLSAQDADVSAQDAGGNAAAETPVEKPEEMPLSDLGGILQNYRLLREEQDEVRASRNKLAGATPLDEEALAKAEARLAKLSENLDVVRQSIRDVAQGFSFQNTQDQTDGELDLRKDLQLLFDPLVNEVREATESTRKLTELATEIDDLKSSRERLEKSLGKVAEARKVSEEPEIQTIFDELASELRNDLTRIDTELTTRELQREELKGAERPLPERIGEGFRDFLSGRGRSLFLAIVLAFGLFWGLNVIHRRLFRRLGRGRNVGSSMAFRVAELLFTIFRFVAALAAAFLVFMAFDDWLLVTLTILILLGLLWGAKEAIFRSYEKVQLLLNLGPVRQGERVTYDGLPYQVRSLSLYPLLENPALSNSTRRITIEELAELRMRHEDDDEPWFVSEKDDWVKLSDGTFGKVIFQSPERVRIEDLGGQIKTIPTSDYLSMTPTNFRTGYAIAATFGIDYSHQQLDYREVASKFATKIKEKLLLFLDESHIIATFSEFKAAGSSSLDYLVVAKVTGEAAPKRFNIERALQQACLDVCNENGWGIPFPQLTVHQAN